MQLTDLSDRQLQTWQQYIDIFAEIQPEIQQRMQPNEQYKHCVDLRLDNKYINPYWIITDQCRLYSIYGNKLAAFTRTSGFIIKLPTRALAKAVSSALLST